MKRFLALVSAVAVCFCSISCSYAAEVIGSASAAQVQDGTEWFCEEHQQPLFPEDEIPDGYEQICLQCNPDVLALAAASPLATESDAQAIFPSGVAYSTTAKNTAAPSTWTNAATLIGEDQSIIYSVPSNVLGSFECLRLVFSSSQPFTFGSYLWYYYGGYAYPRFNNNGGVGYSDSASFTNVTSTVITHDYFQRVFSGSFSRGNSGNTLYLWTNADVPQATLYIGAFFLSSEAYTGDGTGGCGSGGGTEPEEPGFDDPDGWLGGLIDSIIEGINEVIDGIGNIATNIASLPSNIASALSNLFGQVVSAVTSIGSAITGAVDAASSAISSAVDSASSAITGIIGQQWNDQSGHNDDIDQAVSDLENQDQQMGQVEDQYLDDFHEQQSSMAGTVSTFQWPSGITSAMAWITIQMNSIWSGLGGNIQMLFTFSMILGLSLIFLGRWRA